MISARQSREHSGFSAAVILAPRSPLLDSFPQKSRAWMARLFLG